MVIQWDLVVFWWSFMKFSQGFMVLMGNSEEFIGYFMRI